MLYNIRFYGKILENKWLFACVYKVFVVILECQKERTRIERKLTKER